MKNNKIKKYILDILEWKEYYKRHFVNPEKYIPRLFYSRAGYTLNLDNPQTFNEKLQWLKLYDHNPLYTTLVDKYEVKKYVADKIGNQYIIPTLEVWDDVDDIDFNKLPNQFVLKCTHDSGGLVICKDKSNFKTNKAKKVLRKSLGRNFYYMGFEWPYKNVKPRIIAEKYMEDTKTKELRDYKFFCFNGEVKALFIATERQKEGEDVKFDFFDEDFNHLPFKQGHENATVLPQKPLCFDQMKKFAAILSDGIPQVRVDFYEVDGHIYFGEMTFFHHGGWTKFDPEEWDTIFGKWVTLPLRDGNVNS
ncbi:MAG: glycosyl transferase [Prevotella sp.]|nr:glycosyl transferase [Prevotella sp.]